MKRYTSFGLLTLLLAVALALASCAGAGSGGGEQGSKESANDMQDMDHTGMDMSSGGKMDASQMLMKNGEYSDERFIDAMGPHHQGAIDMARVALENAEHPEILELAQNIISSQQAEIEELKSIKQRKFGTSEVPTEMSSEEMKMMGMTEDPGELANQRPFDKAFIDAMIQHHSSAIQMAKAAYERTSDPEIKELSQNIIDAQVGEIEQMTEWRKEWYPEGER